MGQKIEIWNDQESLKYEIVKKIRIYEMIKKLEILNG